MFCDRIEKESCLSAEYLCSSDLLIKEPIVMFGKEDRYAEFFNDPATLSLKSGNTEEIEAVQTFKNIWTLRKPLLWQLAVGVGL